MRVVVSGVGVTKFGEWWQESLGDLAQRASQSALEDAGMRVNEIDLLIVGNMLSGVLGKQVHVGELVAETLGYNGPAVRVEGACASGGLAVRAGIMAIKSQMATRVLVVGVEKMSDWGSEVVTRALMGAGSEEEQMGGATFPALYAMIAREYMSRYKATEQMLAQVAVKNHWHGVLNPKAHFQSKIGVEEVMGSPMVCDPLKLLDCSPVSDGAAAVVLEKRKGKSNEVEIVGSGQGGDSLSLTKREELTTFRATKEAAKQALRQAGIGIKKIKVMEVHDCFTIAEVLAIEDLGLVGVGKGAKRLAQGLGRRNSGGVVINPSGGLKAGGHPVGATGVKQIVEVTQQLRGRAGKRQVKKADWGLTHNVGGAGATAVVHILRRKE